MPIPQTSSQAKFDAEGHELIRQDIGALCRAANGDASKVSLDVEGITANNVADALEELNDGKQPLDEDLTGLASDYTASTKALVCSHVDAATSAGINIGNQSHADVAIFGAGGSQGTTLYGQLNCGAIDSTSASGILNRAAATQDAIALVGRAGGTSSYTGWLTTAPLSAPRTYTFPDAALTVAGQNIDNAFSVSQTFAAGLSMTGSVITATNTANAALVHGFTASSSGNLASVRVRVTNDASTGLSIVSRSSTNSGTLFGVAAANRVDLIGTGASLSALVIGTDAVTAPIVFGINTSEVARLTSTGASFIQPVTVPNGTAAAPGWRLTGEAHGAHRVSATAMGFDIAGALVFTLSSTASSFASGTTLAVANTTASTTTATGCTTFGGGIGVAAQATVRRVAYATGTIATTGAIASLASDDGFTRLTGAAPDVQGIANPGASAARVIFLYCVNATTLRHENGTAAAADRITSDTGADIAVGAGKTVELIYDPTSSRWRPVRY
jgi:hypothetical protein